MSLIRVELVLPTEFPDKYRGAIERAIDHCAVKRSLLEPPWFELRVACGANAEELCVT